MTLTETKARIRRAKELMTSLRTYVNGHKISEFPKELFLPREDFEILEWGMGHLLKEWVPSRYELDADGEPVGKDYKLVRINSLYTRADGTTELHVQRHPGSVYMKPILSAQKEFYAVPSSKAVRKRDLQG